MDPQAYQQTGRNNSRFMSPEDLPASGLLVSKGVVLGKLPNGDRLRFNGDGHIMVFAPTGAGKGIGFVQPNLADYEGSMVVLDPKGENAIVSAQLRRDMGQEIIILDPFGKTGFPSDLYNPLGALTYASNENLGPMVEAIADALVPAQPGEKEPHWTLGAKKFASFLMWFMVAHEPPENRHLVKLFDLAHVGYETLYRMAGAMAAGTHNDPDIRRMCVALGHWLKGRDAREFSFFESQLINNLGWIGDFVWSKVLASPPSEPIDLKDPARCKTVYLVLPFNRLDRYRPWLRVMVADLLNGLYDRPGKLDLPVLFMLDEAFSGLGGMDTLYNAAGAVRSAGARLCFIYQDLQQVQKLYGKQWGSLIANSGVTLFWGVNDLEAAEMVSKYAGLTLTPVPGNPNGIKEPLIAPEAVMRLGADVVLALLKNTPAAKFRRLDVRNDPAYAKLAPNPGETAPPDGGAGPKRPRQAQPVNVDDFPPPPKDGQYGPVAAADDDAESGGDFLADLSAQLGHEVFRDGAGQFYWLNEYGEKVLLSQQEGSESLTAELLAVLSNKHGQRVFAVPDGRYGYLDATGKFIEVE